MKVLKRTAILLCLAIAVSLFAGCTNTSYIIKAGDKTYPVAPYAYYAHYFRDSWAVQAASYYKSKLSDIINNNADTKGTKIYEYIINQTKDSYLTYVYINEKFNEYGLSLSEEDNKAVDEIYNSFVEKLEEAGMQNLTKTIGMTEDEIRDMMSINFKSNAIINHIFGEGGEKEIAESDLLATYKEKYARFKYVVCYGKDFNTKKDLTLDEKNAKRARINEAYEKLKNGEATIEELIPEYSEDYAVSTDETSDSQREQNDGQNQNIIENGVIVDENGIYDYQAYQQTGFTLEQQVTDALFKLKVWEFTVVEVGTDSFWLIQRLDPTEKETYFQDKRAEVFNLMTQDDLTTIYSEWLSCFQYEFNEDTVNKYDPRNLQPTFVTEEEIQEIIDATDSQ